MNKIQHYNLMSRVLKEVKYAKTTQWKLDHMKEKILNKYNSFISKIDVCSCKLTEKTEYAKICLTKNNKYAIISSMKDPNIYVVDLALNTVSHIKREQDVIKALITTEDGKTLFSGSKDGCIEVWNIEEKRKINTYPKAHSNQIRSLVLTSDGKHLVSASSDKSIKVWDIENTNINPKYKEIHDTSKSQATAHSDVIYSIDLSKDDSILASASHDKCIKLWDFKESKMIHVFKNAHYGFIFSVKFSKDSTLLYSSSSDGSIGIWSVEAKKQVYNFLNAHSRAVWAFCLIDNDNLLVSASIDGTLSIWNPQERLNLHTYTAKDFSGVALSIDTSILSLSPVSMNGTIGLGRNRETDEFFDYPNRNKADESPPIYFVTATSDNRFIIFINEYGILHKLDLGENKVDLISQNVERKIANKSIRLAKIAPNQKSLVTVSSGPIYEIHVWKLDPTNLQITEEPLLELKQKEKDEEVLSIDICPDNQNLALGCSNGKVYVLSLSEKENLKSYTPDNREISCVRFIKKDSAINFISTSLKSSIALYDLKENNQLKKKENCHKGWIVALDVSEDGESFVTGSQDKSIKIWTLEDFKLDRDPKIIEKAHKASLSRLLIYNNNKSLISSSQDMTIKIWDLETRKATHIFETSHLNNIERMILSREKTYLISIDTNSSMEVHNIGNKQRILIYKGLSKDEDFTANSSIFDRNIALIGNKIVLDSRGSICEVENSFYEQPNIQISDESSPYTLTRFMPFTAFIQSKDLAYRKNIIKTYPFLKIESDGWNWFHIVAITSANRQLVEECIRNDVPFIGDINGQTPLHYLIEKKNSDQDGDGKADEDGDSDIIGSIDIIFYRFDVILERSQKPCELMQSLGNIFCSLVELDTPHIVNFLKFCIQVPEPGDVHALDIVGTIKGYFRTQFHLSDSIYYGEKARKGLLKNHKKRKLAIRVIPFEWDYSTDSDQMEKLANALSVINHQEIYENKVISILIKYLWRETRYYHFIMAGLFLCKIALISVYTAKGDRNLGLEIPIFVLAIIFLLYDLLRIFFGKIKKFIFSFWNNISLTLGVLVCGTLIAIWCDIETEVRDWLFSFILALGYIRFISYFRVVKQTRKFISMIIEIARDMRSFAFILAVITFGLALVFVQFERDVPYNIHLLTSYRILYSDFDIDSFTSVGKMFYFLIVIALIAIMLLNMLIAIMGETFSRVQEKGQMFDFKEMLALITEILYVGNFLRKIKVSNPETEQKEGKFLFFAEQNSIEETIFQEDPIDNYALLKDYIDFKFEELEKSLEKKSKIPKKKLNQ